MDNFNRNFDAFVKEVGALRDAVGIISYLEWDQRMASLHTKVDKLRSHFREEIRPSTLNERSSRPKVKGDDRIAQSFNLFKRLTRK